MQPTRILKLLAATAVLAGCAAAPQTDAAAVRRVIEDRNAQLEQWYASGQIDSVAAQFAEDAWQMPPNDDPVVGRAAIHAFWSEAMALGEWTFSLETEDVVVSGPIAVERGVFSLALTPGPGAPAGMPAIQDHGNYIVYWRLDDDGEWRVVWDAPVSSVSANGG